MLGDDCQVTSVDLKHGCKNVDEQTQKGEMIWIRIQGSKTANNPIDRSLAPDSYVLAYHD